MTPVQELFRKLFWGSLWVLLVLLVLGSCAVAVLYAQGMTLQLAVATVLQLAAIYTGVVVATLGTMIGFVLFVVFLGSAFDARSAP